MGNPFDGKVRVTKVLTDDELRESLRGGWNEHLPAIKDEHGAVLVGNRRMTIAAEEKIEAVIKVVTFGDGADADAARIRLANVSNIGGAPLSAEDRKRQAEKLYDGGNGMTMQQIANVLGVTKQCISLDLVNCQQVDNPQHAKTATNPKGAGRPKGSRRPPRPRKNESAAAQAAALRILDEGASYSDAENETDLSNTVLRAAVAREEGRRARQVDRADLSITAQQKLDAAIRSARQKLEVEFTERSRLEAIRIVDEMLLPHYANLITETYDKIVAMRFKGLMRKETYRKIKACLHPDRVNDHQLKGKYEEAFRLFTEMEPALLSEADSPTTKPTLPRTYAEFMAGKAHARKRKASGRHAVRAG